VGRQGAPGGPFQGMGSQPTPQSATMIICRCSHARSAQLSAGLSQALADAIPERCQALRLIRVMLRYRMSSMWQSAI